ncbi:MAG TPA: hypothetical protein VN726_05890 [Hanamia sp.]|nr:hypothetical protein [Hanamia sp.]
MESIITEHPQFFFGYRMNTLRSAVGEAIASRPGATPTAAPGIGKHQQRLRMLATIQAAPTNSKNNSYICKPNSKDKNVKYNFFQTT